MFILSDAQTGFCYNLEPFCGQKFSRSDDDDLKAIGGISWALYTGENSEEAVNWLNDNGFEMDTDSFYVCFVISNEFSNHN